MVRKSGIRKFGVRLVSTEDELVRELFAYLDGAYPVLVQERIQGPGLGAFFLSMDGEIVASFAHRRLREKPPTGGVSVLRESVPLREDIRRYSEALLHDFKWSGVAMVEFKEDASTGTPYLMEINGRFWGSLQLAIDAGVDFPALLLEKFLCSDRALVRRGSTDYSIGTQSRWLWGDVDHLLWIFRASPLARRLDPTLPDRLSALARFLMPWHPGRRYEILDMDDMRPFFRESFQWLAAVTASLRK